MRERQYYGGSTVRGGRVRRLTATNFKELVERYVFTPVPFPLTRTEFHKLPEGEMNDKKDGPYITACSFKFPDEGHREDNAAKEVNLVILDLDEGNFVKDFAESPETIGEALYPFSFVAWTTAKHTPAAPRLKIAVDTSCEPSEHRRCVRHVISLLGLPETFKGSRESYTLSLPQYRPLAFRGEEFNAVIGSRLDGKTLTYDDLPDEIPDERVYAAERSVIDDEFMGLLSLPVPNLTLDRVRDALNSIDPDCEYKVWTEVAAALRHQFTTEAEAAEAYQEFDSWSAEGVKYRGESDTYAKWKSFRPYAKGRAPVTIRTLFKHAIDSGWDCTPTAIAIQQDVVAWMDECTDGDYLMQEGANRIAAMPFRNDVVEDALIQHWRKRIARLTSNTIEKNILRKAIAKVRKREAAAKREQTKDNLPSWLQPQYYISTEDVFYNSATGVKLKPAAFDRTFAEKLMAKEAEEQASGRPPVLPSDYALNLMGIQRVDGTIYCPLYAGGDPWFAINGKTYLNTYDHITVPVQDPAFAYKAEMLLRKHLGYLVGDPWIVELLIDFCRVLVQMPGHKIPWVPCIQSAEGVGKGFFARILTGVLGHGNVMKVSPEVLRSQWNDWMIKAQLFILEEVHFPGERREAVMNSLKAFITDPVLPLNQRNTTARSEPSWSNAIAFTNFEDALHLKSTDRRWFPIKSPIQKEYQVKDLIATGHFEEMEWLLSDAGASGLRYFLAKTPISKDFPLNGPAPQTAFRQQIIEQSKNNMQIQIEDLITDDQDPLICKAAVHVGRLTEILSRGGNKDMHRVVHYLATLGYERHEDGRRFLIDGSRGTVWVNREEWPNGACPVDYLRKRLALSEEAFEI